MDEIFNEYGECIVYTLLAFFIAPAGWAFLKFLGTI